MLESDNLFSEAKCYEKHSQKLCITPENMSIVRDIIAIRQSTVHHQISIVSFSSNLNLTTKSCNLQ